MKAGGSSCTDLYDYTVLPVNARNIYYHVYHVTAQLIRLHVYWGAEEEEEDKEEDEGEREGGRGRRMRRTTQ